MERVSGSNFMKENCKYIPAVTMVKIRCTMQMEKINACIYNLNLKGISDICMIGNFVPICSIFV